MFDVHLVLSLNIANDKKSLCLVRERLGKVKSLRKPSRLTTQTKFSGVEMKLMFGML